MLQMFGHLLPNSHPFEDLLVLRGFESISLSIPSEGNPEIAARRLIFAYVLLRPFFAVLYGVDIAFGFNILELAGFLFPIALLVYKVRDTSEKITNSFERFYLFVVMWLLATTVVKIFSYSFNWFEPLSFFLRVLNGFAVFTVFPLIFKDRKSIDSLVNAFFVATFFPLAQGLIQLLIGANIGGMKTSITDGSGGGNYEMYYGLYYKYGGYAWAALCGGLILIYKMGIKTRIGRKREFIYGVLFISSLILASMTLSRVLIFSMVVVIATILVTIRATNAGFLLIATVLVALILSISGPGFFKERYEQVISRSDREFKRVSVDLKRGENG